LEARYYRNRTSDQITSNPIPDFTGFSSLVYNLPATIQNSGWEGIAHASVIKNRDFNWDVNFNISANRNDLVSFPGLANSPYAQIYTIGKPLGGTYVYHCLGVDPLTGQWAFADLNHDGLISGGGAAPQQNQPLDAYFKDLTPTYFGGFSTAFTYKHSLLLSLNFSFKKQIGMNAFSAGYDYGALNDNAPVEVFKDHWRQPGDHAAFPAFTTLSPQSQATFSLSDGAYTDASYLRLQNLSVAYILPGAWLRKVGFSACTIRMNAQNIFVITGYKGIDPETQNFGGMPPARIYTENIIFSF
jgi:hypothetical protein